MGLTGLAERNVSAAEYENTSGQGRDAVVPPEIRGLNWGAFLFQWFWGISNNVRIVWLLFFFPPSILVLPFVLLFKGNEWAWRKQKWQSVAHFQATQKKWSKWALIVVVSFPFLIALFLPIVITALKAPGYYDMGLEKLLSDERVIAALGTPIEPGWWVEGSATLGSAGISVPLKGSKASGRGCFFARKQSGEWVINGLMFSVDEMQEPVILRPFDARGPHGQALGRTFCKYSVSRR